MKLSFTTLGCPQWSWAHILEQAHALGYQGIEVRGIQSELEIDKLAPFAPGAIGETRRLLKEFGLSIPCLDTSCTFLSAAPMAETLRSGRAAIDIAEQVGASYIRVFGDRIPEGMGEEEAVEIVAGGMQALGDYAQDKGVIVLQETHGNFAESRMLLRVYERVKSPAVGVIWDIANPYEFGETVQFTWSQIKHLVRHTHIKDVMGEPKAVTPCLPGQGVVPIGEALKLLAGAGYEGWLSFEWEKRWHGSIEEPEVALPTYIEHVRKYL